MQELPETYQNLYDESVTNIMPEAEKLMMVADEMIADTGHNKAILTNDKVCIEIRRSTKTEIAEYLKSI